MLLYSKLNIDTLIYPKVTCDIASHALRHAMRVTGTISSLLNSDTWLVIWHSFSIMMCCARWQRGIIIVE